VNAQREAITFYCCVLRRCELASLFCAGGYQFAQTRCASPGYAATSTYHPCMSYLRLFFHSIILGFRRVFTSKASIVGLLLPLVLFLLARFAFPANPEEQRYGNAFEIDFAHSCKLVFERRYGNEIDYSRNQAFRKVIDETCFCTTKAVFKKLSWSELGKVNAGGTIDDAIVEKIVVERDACSDSLNEFLAAPLK
jgi:hypothetical protein